MEGSMKRTHFSLIVWIGVCLLLGYSPLAQAHTLSLETTSNGATAKSVFFKGDSLYLNILVDDATGIAGCAFTLTYPADALTSPQISSEGMPVISNDITSFFGFTFLKDGTTYQTHRENVTVSGDVGKIYFSGAAINTTTGGAKSLSGQVVLFTVKFAVKSDAPVKSSYAFSLSPTMLNNTTAGYSAGSEPVPVLMGAVDKNHADWNTLTAAFPVLLQTMSAVTKTFEVTPPGNSQIKGTVIYSGYQQGTLKVGVYNNTDLASSHLVKEVNITIGRTTATRDNIIKDFTIADVQPGQYYMGAYIDANGNSQRDAEEANGRQTIPVTIVGGADSTGNAIALSDPLHSNGEPLYYYNWKQSNPAWMNIGSLFADPDGDGYSNIQEYINQKNGLAGFSPVTPDAPNGPGYGIAPTALYFPHVATSIPWQTEIAIINTSGQTVTGTLRGLSDEGQLVDTRPVTLPARGRKQIIIAEEFTNHTNIGYITFDTTSDTVQGYTKFSREGYYRAAIPAVKEGNTSEIYISHIASTADWWTGISLVNTTSAQKELTITFNFSNSNNNQSRSIILNANEHRAYDIAYHFFNNQPQPDIESAVITNASGVIGLELFGNSGGSNHLDGILLTGNTASTIYYPHVASNSEWWTGIVAYNPSDLACTITITPYSAKGEPLPLSPSTLPLQGKEKYIGEVTTKLNLPMETAWFKIDSTRPITGFELFSTVDGNQLAPYAGGGGTGAKAGVFPKIEKNGWTGIAFVNTEPGAASVTLTAYDDSGTPVAPQVLTVDGHAKVVNPAEDIFSPQDISGATYIAFTSDKNVVGFQLNGSADGMMLDGLPALGGAN
jgi:hypothetical protein